MVQDQQLDVALALGTARLARWTQDGTLIAAAEFAQASGLGAQAMEAAVQRGDLFEVWVNDSPYFPAAPVPLGIEQASMMCRAFKCRTASAKLIFLLRPHGGLCGKTVVEALQTGTPLSRICELAEAWALAFRGDARD